MDRIKIVSMMVVMLVAFLSKAALIKPNPIISRGNGVTVKVSSGDATGLNNNKFGPYEQKKWVVSDNSWIAIKVVNGNYSKVFITFNCPDTTWSDSVAVSGDSCRKNLKIPVDYNILTSSNSTDGNDGDWDIVDSIRGNIVAARGHLVEFDSKKWIKMLILKGSGKIDEVEVFDASSGLEDSWFFLGTKISAFMHKDSLMSGYHRPPDVPDSNFANLIKMYNPNFTPAVIRGGIQCSITSDDVVRDISKYLSLAGNVHFWAIELGTYDAWGGTNTNVAKFTKNLQMIIDSCKSHGIQPIIARIPGTNKAKAGWQIHSDFLKAVDSLTKKNNLIPGADMYTYLTTGLGSYDIANDGVLPNSYGNFELQKQWAIKMDTVVYKAPPAMSLNRRFTHTMCSPINIYSKSGKIIFDVKEGGTVFIIGLNGKIKEKMPFTSAGFYQKSYSRGIYVAEIRGSRYENTVRIINY